MYEEMRGRRFKVLCSDNRMRTAIATSEADTWFSVPARLQAYGKTIRGYITVGSGNGLAVKYEFRVYRYRKNYNVLKLILPQFRLQGEGRYANPT